MTDKKTAPSTEAGIEEDRSVNSSAAVGSAGYLGAAQVARLFLTTLSTVVIARLLSPDDYGVLAMAGPIIGFITMFQDFGLSSAAIQAKNLSHSQSSSLFWMNVSASAVLSLLLLAVSPAVAWFYGDVRAGYVTAASALAMLVGGLGIQHMALLNRGMRFKLLSAIDVCNALATFLVSLALAYAFKSYWALFFGSLAGTVIQTLIVWQRSRFRPRIKPSFKGAGELARFGGHLTGFNLFNFFVRNADAVLIARTAGADQLGLYDRSYKLMMLPIQSVNAPISRLLLPLLSRLRDDPERYRRVFLMAARGMMLISAPGIAIVTVLSNDFMPFLLGSEWAAAGPIFFWLGLTGLIQPVANLTGVLFMSSGRSKTMMWWGIASAVITISAFVIALPWGAVGVAAALFFSLALRLPALMFLAARNVSVTQMDLWRAQIEPLIGCVLAAFVATLLSDKIPLLLNLSISVPLSYALAAASSCIHRDGRMLNMQMIAITKSAIGKTRFSFIVK